MGPLPKRKFSWGRTHRRRSHHALVPVQLIVCDNCGENLERFHCKPFHTPSFKCLRGDWLSIL